MAVAGLVQSPGSPPPPPPPPPPRERKGRREGSSPADPDLEQRCIPWTVCFHHAWGQLPKIQGKGNLSAPSRVPLQGGEKPRKAETPRTSRPAVHPATSKALRERTLSCYFLTGFTLAGKMNSWVRVTRRAAASLTGTRIQDRGGDRSGGPDVWKRSIRFHISLSRALFTSGKVIHR